MYNKKSTQTGAFNVKCSVEFKEPEGRKLTVTFFPVFSTIRFGTIGCFIFRNFIT